MSDTKLPYSPGDHVLVEAVVKAVAVNETYVTVEVPVYGGVSQTFETLPIAVDPQDVQREQSFGRDDSLAQDAADYAAEVLRDNGISYPTSYKLRPLFQEAYIAGARRNKQALQPTPIERIIVTEEMIARFWEVFTRVTQPSAKTFDAIQTALQVTLDDYTNRRNTA